MGKKGRGAGKGASDTRVGHRISMFVLQTMNQDYSSFSSCAMMRYDSKNPQNGGGGSPVGDNK